MDRAVLAERLRSVYLMPLPESFFEYRDFATEVAGRGIPLAQGVLGLRLGSAFDVFAPDFDGAGFDPIWTSRYHDDPPEFLTMLHGATDGLHWGYYADDPSQAGQPELPVVSYFHRDAFMLVPCGNDLFEATRMFLEQRHRDVQQYVEQDDAGGEGYRAQRDEIDALRTVLETYRTGDRSEVGESYLRRYAAARRPTAPTRDGMGILVPPRAYRPLAGADRFLACDYVPSPEDVAAGMAEALRLVDRGFAGTALKLGKDLWTYRQYTTASYELLDAAYTALGRPLLRAMLGRARDFRSRG